MAKQLKKEDVKTFELPRVKGVKVYSKCGTWPKSYSNRTQCENAASKLRELGFKAEAIQPGFSVCFYVRIED